MSSIRNAANNILNTARDAATNTLNTVRSFFSSSGPESKTIKEELVNPISVNPETEKILNEIISNVFKKHGFSIDDKIEKFSSFEEIVGSLTKEVKTDKGTTKEPLSFEEQNRIYKDLKDATIDKITNSLNEISNKFGAKDGRILPFGTLEKSGIDGFKKVLGDLKKKEVDTIILADLLQTFINFDNNLTTQDNAIKSFKEDANMIARFVENQNISEEQLKENHLKTKELVNNLLVNLNENFSKIMNSSEEYLSFARDIYTSPSFDSKIEKLEKELNSLQERQKLAKTETEKKDLDKKIDVLQKDLNLLKDGLNLNEILEDTKRSQSAIETSKIFEKSKFPETPVLASLVSRMVSWLQSWFQRDKSIYENKQKEYRDQLEIVKSAKGFQTFLKSFADTAKELEKLEKNISKSNNLEANKKELKAKQDEFEKLKSEVLEIIYEFEAEQNKLSKEKKDADKIKEDIKTQEKEIQSLEVDIEKIIGKDLFKTFTKIGDLKKTQKDLEAKIKNFSDSEKDKKEKDNLEKKITEIKDSSKKLEDKFSENALKDHLRLQNKSLTGDALENKVNEETKKFDALSVKLETAQKDLNKLNEQNVKTPSFGSETVLKYFKPAEQAKTTPAATAAAPGATAPAAPGATAAPAAAPAEAPKASGIELTEKLNKFTKDLKDSNKAFESKNPFAKFIENMFNKILEKMVGKGKQPTKLEVKGAEKVDTSIGKGTTHGQ